jgi:hypothetical protein
VPGPKKLPCRRAPEVRPATQIAQVGVSRGVERKAAEEAGPGRSQGGGLGTHDVSQNRFLLMQAGRFAKTPGVEA